LDGNGQAKFISGQNRFRLTSGIQQNKEDRFGAAGAVCEAADAGEGETMLDWINEIGIVIRQLRKAPGFAFTVVLTLALGIAATTVIFSLVDAVLLRPLALPEPERLLTLTTLERPGGSTGPSTIPNDVSYPNFFDWRDQNKSFSSMASYTTTGLVVGRDQNGPARMVRGALVSSGFFTTVGVAPKMGRDFQAADDLPGTRSVVLSHDLWQNSYAADPAIVGKLLVLDDRNYTVIGVMPRGFAFPLSNTEMSFWVNMAPDAEGPSPSSKQRGYNQLEVIGRLRPGVTVMQAKAEMDAIQRGLATRYADEDANETAVSVVPVLESLVGSVKVPLRILFASVCCLLLIVCANLAGLMLTRTSHRRGEFAIRAALGATRAKILRQLLVESVLLSLCGGLLGLAVSKALLGLAPQVLPASLPRVHEVGMSGAVIGFAIGISVLTGLVFGVLPAWRASRQDPAAALGENARGSLANRRHYRLQSILVVSQTTLGMVLLIGAGLLIHSFDRTMKVDPGFSPQQMLTFRMAFSPKRFTEEQRTRFVQQLLPQLAAMPGARMATAAFPLPMTQGNIQITFSIQGRPVKPGDEPAARVSLVETNYFQTLQIPVRTGRDFLATEHEEKGQPVVIVNEAFAKQFFPGQNAVGQHLRSGLGDGETPPMREVVGVVDNVKRVSLTEDDEPEYYIPYEQAAVAPPAIAVRVSGNPENYARQVTAMVGKMDANVPVYRMQSYGDEIKRVTAQQRFQTLLLTGFAGVALLLAGVGLYAVLSYMVAQRTTELGLRIALGAPRSNVLQLMLFRGLRLAAVGLALGLVLAATLTRFVAGLLFGVKPLDGVTFATTTLVLLVVSALASLIPAWRAASLDPNDTLRQQ